MEITSPAFTHNESIPAQYTCDGKDMSPPLRFGNVPPQAKSLVLVMDDPDAPAGTWDHWIVFNIPPIAREVAEGEDPPGRHGTGTSGVTAYGGPCPPDREHRYFFKLYALDAMLDLPTGVSKQDLENTMQNHVITQAELMGRYERQTAGS